MYEYIIRKAVEGGGDYIVLIWLSSIRNFLYVVVVVVFVAVVAIVLSRDDICNPQNFIISFYACVCLLWYFIQNSSFFFLNSSFIYDIRISPSYIMYFIKKNKSKKRKNWENKISWFVKCILEPDIYIYI